MKILFLWDGKESYVKDFWINKYFIENEFDYSYIGINNLKQEDLDNKKRSLFLHIKYIYASIKVLFKSQRGDLIIIWLDKMGVYTFFLSKLLFFSRKLIILNIMIPPAKTNLQRLINWLYSLCYNNDCVTATVNSNELIGYYKKNLKLTRDNIKFLPDSINDLEGISENYNEGDGYVFFGGSGGRNFHLMAEIANNMEDVPFVFVVKKKYFPSEINLKSNIKIYYDTSLNEFNRLLSNASLVVLPISVETPAGLLVLITAGLKSKLVICSKTLSIENYINHNVNGVLLESKDAGIWISIIKKYLDMNDQKMLFGKNLNNSIRNNFSNNAYMTKLVNIIDSITPIQNFK